MEVDLRRLFRAPAARADRRRRAHGAVATKLAVVGNTGSGKTTLARRLAAELGVQHVELDALFWRSGWEMTPTAEFRARIDDLTRGPAWVVDGNYFGRLGELVLQRADLVVWLDLPLRTIVFRLVRRTVARVRSREPLWGTNQETFRSAFLSRNSLFVWALKMHFRKRAARVATIRRFRHVRLRSAREAEAWLLAFVAASPRTT